MIKTKQLLIIGNAREMKEIKGETIDFVVTSPPYWNLKKYGNSDASKSYEEYINLIRDVLVEVYRVLRPGKFACINVGTAVSKEEMKHIPSDVINIMKNLGFTYKKEIIWVKPKGTQGLWQRGTTKFLKKMPYPGSLNINIMHEYILIFQKNGEFKILMNEKNKLPEDFIKQVCWSVWEMRVSNTKGHPAAFPDELPKRLIQLYTVEGDCVLDPFGGSGTVMKVARDLNRNSIIYEINSDYLPLIKKTSEWNKQGLFARHTYKIILRKKSEKGNG